MWSRVFITHARLCRAHIDYTQVITLRRYATPAKVNISTLDALLAKRLHRLTFGMYLWATTILVAFYVAYEEYQNIPRVK
jgi:hypothetical protein